LTSTVILLYQSAIMDKTKTKLAAFFERDDEDSSFPVRRTELLLLHLTLTLRFS
jgi:hypothetical protein